MTENVTILDGAQNKRRKLTGRNTDYIPPTKGREARLSVALTGTNRIPEGRQMALLNESRPESDLSDITLYYAGDLSLLKQPCVAIVGTRDVTEQGFKRAFRLARELAEAGVVVVSGLASGVDTAAHTGAMEAGGRTIAVIGTPLDKAYPRENARLQETIYHKHLLVSQFAPGTKIYRSSFPQRNKLMAALTDATVVIEAGDTSGTLHQAAECTRLGRWLFVASSVVDDPSLKWPRKFLMYKTTISLKSVEDITTRLWTSSV